MFKLSRVCQERFVLELCCDSFARASPSRPSGLGMSSRALVWDPDLRSTVARDLGFCVQVHVRPVFDTKPTLKALCGIVCVFDV